MSAKGARAFIVDRAPLSTVEPMPLPLGASFRAGVKALIATHRLKAVLKKLKRETLVPGSLSDAQSGEEKDKGVVSESVKSGNSIASSSSGQVEHWREVNPEDVELRVTEDVESAERDEH